MGNFFIFNFYWGQDIIYFLVKMDEIFLKKEKIIRN